MKNLCLSFLAIFALNFAFAAPNNRAINNGSWNVAGTWSLNRVPMIGDTITIMPGKTITINDDQNLIGFVTLKVYGKLEFVGNSATLNLGILSSIFVFTNGRIEGNGSSSQKLKIGSSQIFRGSDDDVVGPLMANAATNDFVFFNEPQVTLPVKFVGFTATLNNHNVLLQWSTAEETGSSMYELERSLDGSKWNTIAYVAAAGTTQNLNNYSYTDKNIIAKTVYYRIRQVDVNGNFSYTAIRTVKNELIAAQAIRIAAISSKVLLQFSGEIKGNLVVRFLSLNGQLLEQQTISQARGQVVLTTKQRGNQIISVSNGLDVNIAQQVIL